MFQLAPCKQCGETPPIHMPADLTKRNLLAEFIMNSPFPAGLEAERADLLELLEPWKSGTLHGILPVAPSLDPNRPSGHCPSPTLP